MFHFDYENEDDDEDEKLRARAMNSNQPSREQIEARITALLLNELPEEEAALLRWTLSQDPELSKLHDRLKTTIGLVRETVAHPAEAPMEKIVVRRLSEERRRRLLDHFKTPRPTPKPLYWLKRIEVRPLVGVLAALALIAVLAAMLMPALSAAKRGGGSARITATQTDMAKQAGESYKAYKGGIVGYVEQNPAKSAPATPALGMTPPQVSGGGVINAAVGTAEVSRV